MGRVIAISNQKGGVGKTTTAINLSACLAEKGKRVLTIDMDPQGNTTSGLGIDKSTVEHTSYQLLTNETTIWEAMTPSTVPGLSVIASERSLAGAEIELIGVEDREFILKKEVDKVRDNYDFVIIDCPPSLNTLTVNAMTTADTVLVPIQCEYYALEGLSQLMSTIKQVKRLYNPVIELEGILLTMYDRRLKLTEQVEEEVKTHFPDKVYKTIIPRNVRLSEAPSFGMPALYFDPHSRGSRAYQELTKEILKKYRNQK